MPDTPKSSPDRKPSTGASIENLGTTSKTVKSFFDSGATRILDVDPEKIKQLGLTEFDIVRITKSGKFQNLYGVVRGITPNGLVFFDIPGMGLKLFQSGEFQKLSNSETIDVQLENKFTIEDIKKNAYIEESVEQVSNIPSSTRSFFANENQPRLEIGEKLQKIGLREFDLVKVTEPNRNGEYAIVRGFVGSTLAGDFPKNNYGFSALEISGIQKINDPKEIKEFEKQYGVNLDEGRKLSEKEIADLKVKEAQILEAQRKAQEELNRLMNNSSSRLEERELQGFVDFGERRALNPEDAKKLREELLGISTEQKEEVKTIESIFEGSNGLTVDDDLTKLEQFGFSDYQLVRIGPRASVGTGELGIVRGKNAKADYLIVDIPRLGFVGISKENLITVTNPDVIAKFENENNISLSEKRKIESKEKPRTVSSLFADGDEVSGVVSGEELTKTGFKEFDLAKSTTDGQVKYVVIRGVTASGQVLIDLPNFGLSTLTSPQSVTKVTDQSEIDTFEQKLGINLKTGSRLSPEEIAQREQKEGELKEIESFFNKEETRDVLVGKKLTEKGFKEFELIKFNYDSKRLGVYAVIRGIDQGGNIAIDIPGANFGIGYFKPSDLEKVTSAEEIEKFEKDYGIKVASDISPESPTTPEQPSVESNPFSPENLEKGIDAQLLVNKFFETKGVGSSAENWVWYLSPDRKSVRLEIGFSKLKNKELFTTLDRKELAFEKETGSRQESQALLLELVRGKKARLLNIEGRSYLELIDDAFTVNFNTDIGIKEGRVQIPGIPVEKEGDPKFKEVRSRFNDDSREVLTDSSGLEKFGLKEGQVFRRKESKLVAVNYTTGIDSDGRIIYDNTYFGLRSERFSDKESFLAEFEILTPEQVADFEKLDFKKYEFESGDTVTLSTNEKLLADRYGVKPGDLVENTAYPLESVKVIGIDKEGDLVIETQDGGIGYIFSKESVAKIVSLTVEHIEAKKARALRMQTSEWFQGVIKAIQSDPDLEREFQEIVARHKEFKSITEGDERHRDYTAIFSAIMFSKRGKRLLQLALMEQMKGDREALLSQIENEKTYVPEVVIGTGIHGSIYAVNKQMYQPDSPVFAVDKEPVIGGQFAQYGAAAFRLNSRNRPEQRDGEYLPGTSQALNTFTAFATLQPGDTTGEAYAHQSHLGEAAQVNFFLGGKVITNMTLERVRRNLNDAEPGKYILQMHDKESGKTHEITTDRIIFPSGLGKENSLLDETDFSTKRILDEEKEKFRNGEDPRVMSFLEFLKHSTNPADAFPLRGMKNVIISGSGDSSNVIAGMLLGYESQMGKTATQLDNVEKIFWIGQKLPTKEEFVKNIRVRYLQVGLEFPRSSVENYYSRIVPIPERSRRLKRQGENIVVVTDNGQEIVGDHYIYAHGFEDQTDFIVGGVRAEVVESKDAVAYQVNENARTLLETVGNTIFYKQSSPLKQFEIINRRPRSTVFEYRVIDKNGDRTEGIASLQDLTTDFFKSFLSADSIDRIELTNTSGISTENVEDTKQEETIALKYENTEIYKIGPAAGIPLSEDERNKSEALRRISENTAAIFRYANKTKELAKILAKKDLKDKPESAAIADKLLVTKDSRKPKKELESFERLIGSDFKYEEIKTTVPKASYQEKHPGALLGVEDNSYDALKMTIAAELSGYTFPDTTSEVRIEVKRTDVVGGMSIRMGMEAQGFKPLLVSLAETPIFVQASERLMPIRNSKANGLSITIPVTNGSMDVRKLAIART